MMPPSVILRTLSSVLALAALAAALPGASAEAQSLWSPEFDRGSVQVQMYKPSLASDPDLALESSVWFFTARAPVSPRLFFVADASFSHMDFDGDASSSSTMGNPYLGVEIAPGGGDFAVEVGTRLPLVDEREFAATVYGLYADISRWGAWVPDMVPVSLLARYRTRDERGFGVRGDFGPVLWIPKGDRDDAEVLVRYTLQAWFQDEAVRVGGGFNGLALLTEDDFDLGESTLHEFGLSAALKLGTVWPGLQFKIPLDSDLSETVDYTLGLQLAIPLH